MTLAFSTYWKKDMPEQLAGKPTYFIEKIWASIVGKNNINISHYEEYLIKHKKLFNCDFGYEDLFIYAKYHTIRKDSNNRWKEGNNIHFVINNRTKDRFQFAPVIPCITTQRIDINYSALSGLFPKFRPFVHIDDRVLDDNEIEQLAINDGFDSVDDFFCYFNTDFSGKIIHWTDLKY